jgi:hypothetical protein
MIYYEGDAVPELKGMFLFGSFTGDIYALRLSEDKKSIVEELKIELSHFPFVPTVGIAQSPDGKIYYGGYQIYTLDSIGERKQILFPIDVSLPYGVNIKDISVDQDQRRMLIDTNVNGTVGSDDLLTIQIPKGLLENLTAVTIDSPQGPSAIEFNIDEFGPDYTRVSVNIGSNAANEGDLKLTIS